MELWGLKSLFGFNVYREIQQIPNERRCQDEDDWYRTNLSKSFFWFSLWRRRSKNERENLTFFIWLWNGFPMHLIWVFCRRLFSFHLFRKMVQTKWHQDDQVFVCLSVCLFLFLFHSIKHCILFHSSCPSLLFSNFQPVKS